MKTDELARSLISLAAVDEPSRQAVQEILLAIGGDGRQPPTLPPASGRGTPDGMEPRIAKLEAHMEHVLTALKNLDTVPADFATVKTQIAALPDKDWVGTKMRNWVGGGVAFLTLVTIAAKFIHLG